MSHRILRIVYLVVPIGLIVAFAFRPTPILGVDGESLAASTGADLAHVTFEPCAEQKGDEWTCTLPGEGESAPTTISLDVGWEGCWTAKVLQNGSVDPPAEGCVTLMDHFESID
ncbi:MAG: hypothetical protein M3Y34_04180 [Actinomycetota bacterium]|nr:hypothetical protein [Actinomycetota bacterium]